MGFGQFLYATVLSVAVTVGNKYLEDYTSVASKYRMQERNRLVKIIDPGFDWEGNEYANWIALLAGMYYLDVPDIVKIIMVAPRFGLPIIYNRETPFNTTYLMMGAASLLNYQWILAAMAFGKVLLYDLRSQWFVYSLLEQRADVGAHIATKTTIFAAYPVIYILLNMLFSAFYGRLNAMRWANYTTFVLSVITWIYLIPYFNRDKQE